MANVGEPSPADMRFLLRAGFLPRGKGVAQARPHPYPEHVSLHHPADLCLVGGQVADVRAGVLRRAAVAITGDRISAIGPDDALVAGARQIIDVSGRIIVPGYIEPHTHVVLASPVEFARAVLPLGTTTAMVDALPLQILARRERLPQTLEQLAALPVQLRWLLRLHPQSFSDEERFSLEILRRLWRLPAVAAVGEVTRWTDVLDGDPDLVAKIRAAREDGKPVEGHAPGASYPKLAALAAAGITSCHEAITPDEVLDRLRAGLWVMLRHNSIRPDLPALAAAGTDPVLLPRLMLTADGPMPLFIAAHGYMDYVISIAIDGGIPPLAALRMATLNPATYFGLDDLGEVAVGKRADLNVLRSLLDPRPQLVIAGGQIAAHDGHLVLSLPDLAWGEIFERFVLPRLDPEAFIPPAAPPIMLRLLNDVITEIADGDPGSDDTVHAVLIDRVGRWLSRCRLSGFVHHLGGVATTLNSAFHLLVLGQHPADMARAADRLAELGGGLVVVEGGREVLSLAFDAGPFSTRPWAEIVEVNRRFNDLMRERGFRFADPLFTLLFLPFDSLPWARLTSRGVWDVRNRRVLEPSIRLP